MSELRITSKYDAHFKAIVVGNSGVGKTCLISQFVNDKFSPSFITTIGIDFRQKIIRHDGKIIAIQLWDTAGQERYRSITTSYYRGCDGILFIYDVTDRKSFDAVDEWIRTAENLMDKSFIKILVANKIDNWVKRVVTSAEGEMLAKVYKMPYVECSAKTGENVADIFAKFCDLAIPTFFVPPKPPSLLSGKPDRKRCCQ
jgi:Ras-related protein Rab-8A